MIISEIEELQGIEQQHLEELGFFFCDFCDCPKQEIDHHIRHINGDCEECQEITTSKDGRDQDGGCPWCGRDCPDAGKPEGCWYQGCPDFPHGE